MDVSFEWFESLCDGLSRNPAAATKTLEQFRESEVAVDATLFFLSNPAISHIGTFQAVSILHRASIVRWGSMSVEKRSELRRNMIDTLTKVVSTQAPSFVVNKVMQVCASIWKRGWLEISDEEKDAYFQFANNMMQAPATSRAATALLRVTLEEFSQQSFAEINMQYTFHADAKRVFQKNDLIKVFTLAVHPLNILFSWQDAASIAPHIPLMGELFKLLSELITWNFKEDSLNNRNNTCLEENNTLLGQCNKLPREWATSLIQSNFVMNLYNMYSALCLQPQNFQIDTIILSNCALELRNLILCLPTIDGEIFHSLHEKRDFGNLILEYSIQLVQHFIVRSEGTELIVSDASIDYEEGGQRQEQLDFFLSVCIRLISNYKLSTVCSMTQFEKAMIALSSVTLEISKELLVLSQYSMQLYQQYLNHTTTTTTTGSTTTSSSNKVSKFEMPADTLLMNTWRGGILALSLDAWGLVLENPTVMVDTTLFNPATAPTASSSNTTTTATNTHWNSELINWIQNTTNDIFITLFQAFFHTFLFETLNEVNEEENEEDALIESRQTGDFLIAICTIGRVNFSSSLLYIHNILNNSITELQTLSQQSIVTLNNNNNNNYIYCIQGLEKCRICIEFASYLCIDVFHENSSEMNKETPTINDAILFQLSIPNSNGLVVLHDFVGLIATLLQWETQLVVSTATNSSTTTSTAPHPLESPYLLQAVYRFFTEYVLRFIDPDSEQYSVETLAVAAGVLQHMHGK